MTDAPFIIDGKFMLDYNPHFMNHSVANELERQRTCKRAYCLNCKHVQPCGFDDVFVCEECGWSVGEAIP